ncbi:MAG: hypothetical protein ACSHXF_16480 [Aquaticitalea sp.]
MHNQLILNSFEKARHHLILQGISEPSKRQQSIELSTYLTDDYGFPFGDKSLRNYYGDAVALKDVRISQLEVIKGLCLYLGYSDFQDYMCQANISDVDTAIMGFTQTETHKTSATPKKKKNQIIFIGVGLIVVIGIVIAMSINKQRWMIWVQDHYEEVDFDQEKLSNGTLKLYKEDRIEDFRKVENADCDYHFFNKNGAINVWYGKNKEGHIELFTDIGLHPETGKSLKPISKYMIRKYFCETY